MSSPPNLALLVLAISKYSRSKVLRGVRLGSVRSGMMQYNDKSYWSFCHRSKANLQFKAPARTSWQWLFGLTKTLPDFLTYMPGADFSDALVHQGNKVGRPLEGLAPFVVRASARFSGDHFSQRLARFLERGYFVAHFNQHIAK